MFQNPNEIPEVGKVKNAIALLFLNFTVGERSLQWTDKLSKIAK